jgi:hypothetical protein
MFLQNKYTLWYFNIIQFAKKRNIINVYFEKHHIVPKSLGGDNSSNNIVKLTAKEHYIVHHLLTKMTKGDSKLKMVNAFWYMTNIKPNKLTPKQYQIIKSLASETHSILVKNKWDDPNSLYNTPEYRLKQSELQKEVQNRTEVKEKIFEKTSKNYTLISPNGTTYAVKGLKKFCRENKLHAGNMSWLANGKLKYYKGWSCIKAV